MTLQGYQKKMLLAGQTDTGFTPYWVNSQPPSSFPWSSSAFLWSYSTTVKVKYCPDWPVTNKPTSRVHLCFSHRVKPQPEVGGKDRKLVAKGPHLLSTAQPILAEGLADPARDLKIGANAVDGKELFFLSCVKLIVSAKIRKIKKRASVALLKNEKKKKKGLGSFRFEASQASYEKCKLWKTSEELIFLLWALLLPTDYGCCN